MDLDRTELYILKGFLTFGDYAAKFIDKVQPDSFSQEVGPIIKAIRQFYLKYQKSPSMEILCDKALPKYYRNDEERIEQAESILQEAVAIKFERKDYYDWLIDETKTFIKKNALLDAMMEAVNLIEKDRDNDDLRNQAVQLVLKANSISFDDDLGLDYWDELDERGERMKTGVAVIPTGMNKLDRLIGGGWHRKSLNIFGAGTNVGKTLILSDICLKLISQGYNGIYISLEIYEDLLANRIDANLIDVPLSDLPDDPDFMINTIKEMRKEAEAQGKPFGRLIIKEKSPGCLCANDILALVRDLELKRMGFKPDFIMIDYIGLMVPNASSFTDNTYGKLKTVAEELRSVGSRLDVPVFSAVQVNRDAYNSSHQGLENTADSMGIPMTADLMIMATRNETQDEENKMTWFIAKSRYSRNNSVVSVDVEYEHMRIKCEDDDSVNINDDLLNMSRKAKERVKSDQRVVKDGIIDKDDSEEEPSSLTTECDILV